jgi:hypothetical protein
MQCTDLDAKLQQTEALASAAATADKDRDAATDQANKDRAVKQQEDAADQQHMQNQDALANKVEDDAERDAQFKRDQIAQATARKNAQEDKQIAKQDKKDKQSDDNDFNIKANFLSGAGEALVDATGGNFCIVICTDQQKDVFKPVLKKGYTIATELVDVSLSDLSTVNFEATIFK